MRLGGDLLVLEQRAGLAARFEVADEVFRGEIIPE
jgi:hypothetical protein